MRRKAKNRFFGTKSLSFRFVALRIYFHVPVGDDYRAFVQKKVEAASNVLTSVKPKSEVFGNPIL